MADDWKINRTFDYTSVNYYYTNKIKAFPTADITVLPETDFDGLNVLGQHFKEVAATLGLELPKCELDDMYLWSAFLSKIPAEKHSNAWKFREYVFGCAMIFIGRYVAGAQAATPPPDALILLEAHNRPMIPNFSIKDHSFTIVGSSELTSDIDITIQGPHSSFLISLIEDLFIALTVKDYVPIRCWDVEFYGDFHLLQSMFVNFQKFSKNQRAILLKYAIVSYFRSTHQVENKPPTIHPNAEFLIKHCLKVLKGASDDTLYNNVIQNAYTYWRTTAPMGDLNRELFYRNLFSVESDSEFVKPFLVTSDTFTTSDNEKIDEVGASASEMAFSVFSTLAQANIHRAESYVLPSTAIHVVEFEQKKVGKSTLGLPDSWFASNARIGIDPFGFLLSAIEQLGYLEHYHPPETACNKKGIKYFGRFIRALTNAGLIEEASPLTAVYKELNAYRSSKDPAATCAYNVHTLLNDILGGKTGGARRKTRRLRRRRYRS